ncbi:hypothetical protein QJS10_CPB20g01404 [Acorus calamus]|uniref:Uncharacterized protein n=1 Tax=Acorus calamus TaxID=4465 RepID=A0AAV9CBU2_ACOCL|nr:hypothetical protein QJS10_CPB20g01404 [Acorus calamus]
MNPRMIERFRREIYQLRRPMSNESRSMCLRELSFSPLLNSFEGAEPSPRSPSPWKLRRWWIRLRREGFGRIQDCEVPCHFMLKPCSREISYHSLMVATLNEASIFTVK